MNTIVGPQHFILPTILLVVGLSVAFITFINEGYKSRKMRKYNKS